LLILCYPSHPVAQALKNDPENAWLLELVNAFNSGKIGEWTQLKTRHSARIQQHGSVANSLELLEEKIRVLALIELVWSRPADGRTLPFGDVAAATQLRVDQVELLVMRALALGLIKGEIDQVQGVVVVTHVLPRVLSFDQIAAAKDRVCYWREHVGDTLVNHMDPHHELLK
jgi:26S proteasome regulatory subunit N9